MDISYACKVLSKGVQDSVQNVLMLHDSILTSFLKHIQAIVVINTYALSVSVISVHFSFPMVLLTAFPCFVFCWFRLHFWCRH